MERDPKYLPIKMLLLNGKIKTFSRIFTGNKFHFSVLARATHISPARMKKIIDNPGLLTYSEAIRIAEYFEVPASLIVLNEVQ